MKKLKEILKLTAGICIIPIIFALFLIDRAVLYFLVWMEAPSVKTFYAKTDQIVMALYRMVGVIALYGLAQILKWIVNGIF